jgi:hypothetical protein
VLDVEPRLVAALFGALSVALAVLSLASKRAAVGVETARLLDTDAENSVGAWFNSAQLLVCALLLASIALAPTVRALRWRWWVLAAGFAVMSVDEIVAVHEVAAYRFAAAIAAEGAWAEIWVVPAAVFALGVGLVMLPLLRSLPRPTLVLLVLAAVVYLGGALGLELVGSVAADAAGRDSLAYQLSATVEELFEGLGLAVLATGLASYQRGLGTLVPGKS